MSLLTAKDVRDLVPQEDFSDDQLAVTMRLVAGWLREDSGLTELPDPLLDTHALWSPALELVALVAENPTSLASRTSGPTSATWPQARRRDAIRAGVRATYRAATGGPRGSFPPAQPWPDPALPAKYWDPVRQVWCVA
ncbi:hypothetical protein [Blastococcus sp. CT_GayMR16]|uniref:hypothetical protein n=1 Tax=Blastococcus sp. CT_GayMR16 TaxID=2559607 RepID=UPI0010741B56|nr:hypothetical protein [Blastococcus sp. CT_GayMR16]TFV90396.1 hypothetical protein E4P38_02850 [Blastococcus sp. CT_GayMR16]